MKLNKENQKQLKELAKIIFGNKFKYITVKDNGNYLLLSNFKKKSFNRFLANLLKLDLDLYVSAYELLTRKDYVPKALAERIFNNSKMAWYTQQVIMTLLNSYGDDKMIEGVIHEIKSRKSTPKGGVSVQTLLGQIGKDTADVKQIVLNIASKENQSEGDFWHFIRDKLTAFSD